MNIQVDIDVASTSDRLPSTGQMELWISAPLVDAPDSDQRDAEVSVSIVDEEESQESNLRFRQNDKPTNVLSFPADMPPEIDIPLSADLVVCVPVVEHGA